MGFSVNALFYGDQLWLAQRCLESIVASAQPPFVDDIRVALNEPSQEVVDYVYETLFRTHRDRGIPCYVFREKNFANVCKYPLMRRMFHSTEYPLTSTQIMWFDDDSFIRDQRLDWWRSVSYAAREAAQLGSRYSIASRGKQHVAITQQPWYTGKQFNRGQKFTFLTGGWWVARTSVLKRWDYPFPVLRHNGGDSILGELLRQQRLPMVHWREGVAINADEQGVESKAPRRGLSGKVPWPWQDYEIGQQPDLSHHDFELVVEPCLSPSLPFTGKT